jgi:hypothetical protein
MNKASIGAVSIVLGLIALGGCLLGAGDKLAQAQPVPAAVIGIDVETSGNGQDSLGTIEKCIEVSSGETFDIDVFLNAVPQDQNFSAQEYFLDFDNTKLTAVAENYDVDLILLGKVDGSRILDVSEIRVSSFYSVVLDSQLPPEEVAEQPGDLGVLGRYTFQAIDSGFAYIYLSHIVLGNSDGDDWFATSIDEVWDGNSGYGRIAIDQLCSEAPIPSPTLTATPTTAVATPTPVTATPEATALTEEENGASDFTEMPWIALYAAVGAVVVLVGAVALALARRR